MTCRHGADETTCGACGLVEMENWCGAPRSKSELTLAEAEERFPDAIVQMDHQIPHIIQGEDFKLKAGTGKKKLQASCRIYGEHRRARVFDLMRRLAPGMWDSPSDDPQFSSFNRCLTMTSHDRLTATWHAHVGLWCFVHAHFPLHPQHDARPYPIKRPGETLDMHDFRVSIERVQKRVVSAMGIPAEILHGHRADQIVIDDPFTP